MPQFAFITLRLFEQFIKLMTVPIALVVGLKMLAVLLLFLEDLYSNYQVKREAKRLLKEAEDTKPKRDDDAPDEGASGGSCAARRPSLALFRRRSSKTGNSNSIVAVAPIQATPAASTPAAAASTPAAPAAAT